MPAWGAYRNAIAYVKTKTRPWKGLSSATQDPFIRLQVADMDVKIGAARQVVIQAARIFEHSSGAAERDSLCATAVAQAKVAATETALDVTSAIFQVMGASSATATNGFDRYFREPARLLCTIRSIG